MPLSTIADVEKATSAYDFTVETAKKEEYDLHSRHGKPTIIVNVAMRWGYTEKGLGLGRDLFNKYKEQGFEVLGFPTNEFGSQNPESAEETVHVACGRYKAEFPMMAKILVNGDKANPLWMWLKKEMPGVFGTEGIKWNFTFFLLDGRGKVVERWGPVPTIEEVEKKLVPLFNVASGTAGADENLLGGEKKKEKTCCCC
jgi:glutathione peroxidase-type tryparedoxin peroxidase